MKEKALSPCKFYRNIENMPMFSWSRSLHCRNSKRLSEEMPRTLRIVSSMWKETKVISAPMVQMLPPSDWRNTSWRRNNLRQRAETPQRKIRREEADRSQNRTRQVSVAIDIVARKTTTASRTHWQRSARHADSRACRVEWKSRRWIARPTWISRRKRNTSRWIIEWTRIRNPDTNRVRRRKYSITPRRMRNRNKVVIFPPLPPLCWHLKYLKGDAIGRWRRRNVSERPELKRPSAKRKVCCTSGIGASRFDALKCCHGWMCTFVIENHHMFDCDASFLSTFMHIFQLTPGIRSVLMAQISLYNSSNKW